MSADMDPRRSGADDRLLPTATPRRDDGVMNGLRWCSAGGPSIVLLLWGGCASPNPMDEAATGTGGTTAAPVTSSSSSSGVDSPPGSGVTSRADTGATTSVGDSTGGGDTTADSTGVSRQWIHKSLVIAVDGLHAQAFQDAATPALDSVIGGTWADGYGGAVATDAFVLTDAASVSGPNHWAIMTGAVARQHGVQSNGETGQGDADAFPHYLSLLERSDPSLESAYLVTWSPDLDIPCEADYLKDGEDDSNTERAVQILAGTFEDAAGDLGSAWVAGGDPDAIFIFLDNVDGAGHANGFGASFPEYMAAVELADERIGNMLDALVARPTFAEENWQVVVTTDHGGTAGGTHGGDTLEELTVPFIIGSRTVESGPLPAGADDAGTKIVDVVPSVLDHMGVEIPAALTGLSRALGAP